MSNFEFSEGLSHLKFAADEFEAVRPQCCTKGCLEINLRRGAMKMHDKQLRLQFLGLMLILVFSSSCNSTPPTTPITTPTSSVTVTKDVIYATSLQEDGKTWTLDVYTPVEAGERPIVVLLHGLGGNKEGYTRVSEIIAESGVTVFTVTWPVSIVDIAAKDNGRGYREISEAGACAIRFARATAADVSGDAHHVTLIAHSYGTLYGAWIALASDDLDAQWDEFLNDRNGPLAQVDCARSSYSARVDAFIGIGGGRYAYAEVLQERDPELWEIVSPYSHFGRNLDVPFRLLHGERDTVANPKSSQMFNDVLLEAGYDSRVILFNGGHIVPPQLTIETVFELVSK
jgi:predicted esterase